MPDERDTNAELSQEPTISSVVPASFTPVLVIERRTPSDDTRQAIAELRKAVEHEPRTKNRR